MTRETLDNLNREIERMEKNRLELLKLDEIHANNIKAIMNITEKQIRKKALELPSDDKSLSSETKIKKAIEDALTLDDGYKHHVREQMENKDNIKYLEIDLSYKKRQFQIEIAYLSQK